MIAEDIIQNVFLKFFEKFEEIRNLDSANYWLFTSARNEFYNYYRRNKKMIEIDENILVEKESDIELESIIESNDFKKLVLNELNKMTEEQKEVYLLKEYGGLSYKEIAKTMGIDEDLVKSRLYKVRQKLINKISNFV